jgi:hypothetical protein
MGWSQEAVASRTVGGSATPAALLSLDDSKVRFTWKDYRACGKTKVMTLDAYPFSFRQNLRWS